MSDKTVLTDDAIYQMAKDAGFFLHDEQLKLEYPIGYSEAQKRMLKFARAVIAAATPGQVEAVHCSYPKCQTGTSATCSAACFTKSASVSEQKGDVS